MAIRIEPSIIPRRQSNNMMNLEARGPGECTLYMQIYQIYQWIDYYTSI